jgi:hypothetical protein
MFPMSESPVHCLEFRCDRDAAAALAILSSRIVFWLWHVLGDGFHVSSRLFDAVPFSRASFSFDAFEELATAGQRLWRRLQQNRYTSLNGGRVTIGYRPFQCGSELDAIDALLAGAAGLSHEFLHELRAFIRSNTIVDDADTSRTHLLRQFRDNTL